MNTETSAPESVTGSCTPRSVSEAVVTAVADAKDVSPVALHPPLYDVIEPDALDDVIASLNRWDDESTGRIEFSYSGCEITVSGDGQVSVTPCDSREE